MTKCLKCDLKAVQDSYCRTHYIEYKEEIYTDNTSENVAEWGILKWAKDMIPEALPQSIPHFHHEIYQEILGQLDPFYINKQERLRNLVAYRGGAKSTVIFIICSYILSHNNQTVRFRFRNRITEVKLQERLIVIASETGNMAEDFVVRIRDEFTSNAMLRYFYKFTIEDAMDAIDGQWTRRAFKMNRCYMLGVGAKMQIRGRIKGVSRPTWIFFDDIFSENNTITPESRQRIQSWFDKAAINTVDDLKGKATFVGTIVHDDTINAKLRKSDVWKTIEYPIMPHPLFEKFIKEHLKVDYHTAKCHLFPLDKQEGDDGILQIREYYSEVQAGYDWKLAWPERADLYFLALKYKEMFENDTVAGFYQEYFHITVPSENKKFFPQYFQKIPKFELSIEHGYSWIKFENEEQKKRINIEFGVDFASGSSSGDKLTIVITGVTPDRKRYVLKTKGGRWNLRDIFFQDEETRGYNSVMIDRSKIMKIGLIDELFRLYLEYAPTCIKVGMAGEERQFLVEIQRVFFENGVHVPIVPRKQSVQEGKKEDRITQMLEPYYSTYMVWHNEGCQELEYELEYLGGAEHDDFADACEVSFFNIQIPADLSPSLFNNPVRKKKSPFKLLSELKSPLTQDDWRVN